jgi:hypothetical protein
VLVLLKKRILSGTISLANTAPEKKLSGAVSPRKACLTERDAAAFSNRLFMAD